MKKVDWIVKGSIKLRHNDVTIENAFGPLVPLVNVKVQLSARQKVLGVWSPWNSWGNTRTDKDGNFAFVEQKDKDERQFKLEVLFKDDNLKIYPENDGLLNKLGEAVTSIKGPLLDYTEDAVEQLLEQTSRLAYDVKWMTVYQDDRKGTKHNHGTVNLGNITFNEIDIELVEPDDSKHAFIWFVAREVLKFLNLRNVGFDPKKPLAIKFPHNNPWIKDFKESAYADPANHIVFLTKTTDINSCNVDTIVHELMHIWAYQHSRGEMGMAWQLAVHGSTHGTLTAKPFVAFHEGFAEWASNQIIKNIFKINSDIYGILEDTGAPFSRNFLETNGVHNVSEAERSEFAWISLFNILTTRELFNHEFNTVNAHVTKSSVAPTPGIIYKSIDLHFNQILQAFELREEAGIVKYMKREDMTFDGFLSRIDKHFDTFKTEYINGIKLLLDPSKTENPHQVIFE